MIYIYIYIYLFKNDIHDISMRQLCPIYVCVYIAMCINEQKIQIQLRQGLKLS